MSAAPFPAAPTADDIAFALVRACRMLGEKPELLFLGGPPSLAARHALAALDEIFPAARLDHVAEACAIKAGGADWRAAFLGQDGFSGDVHRDLTLAIRVRRRLWARAR
jgi:hypothetical protein